MSDLPKYVATGTHRGYPTGHHSSHHHHHDPERALRLWDRRAFLRGMCLGGLATLVAPSVSFARVPSEGSRFVFVLCRGGFDGLAAAVPVGDPGYAALRGAMAFGPELLHPLTDGFALAPGLADLAPFWDAGELAVAHAMAIPYRTRSHFDGQAVLETGLDRPAGASDGWLNRLLQVMDGEAQGIAVSAGLPRSLAGRHPVLTWSPARLGSVDEAFHQRLHVLYQHDALLHDRFEAALQLQALQEEEPGGGGGGGMGGGDPSRAGGGRGSPVSAVMEAVARFLRDPEGPNVAAVEFGGWDTHAAQGMAGGLLDRLLGGLATGLDTLRQGLGPAWPGTTVVVMTEFGRTARANGTGGTDHGTGGAGFVLGSRLGGSRIVADWPGLGPRELHEGRDLRGTMDTRALLKAALQGTFDLTGPQLDRIFPGSAGVAPVAGLMG
jgi:uncharacterized protein (DUF1501 family)